MDTLDCIRTFLAVVDQGSFTGAASFLRISPNLVSKRVAALEDRLSVQLMQRTTRRVSLTETGASYAERVRSLLEDFDALEASVTDSHTEPRGHLRITAPEIIGNKLITPATNSFLEAWPRITAEITFEDRFTDIVAEGYDLAVRIGRLDDSSVISKRIAETRHYIVAAPAYVAKHGTPESPADLTNHQCVLDANLRNGDLWPYVENGEERTVKVSGRVRLNNIESIRSILIAGGGVGFAPGYSVSDDLKAGRLISLFPAMQLPPVGVYVLYPQNRHLAGKVRHYIDHLTSFFKNLPNDI